MKNENKQPETIVTSNERGFFNDLRVFDHKDNILKNWTGLATLGFCMYDDNDGYQEWNVTDTPDRDKNSGYRVRECYVAVSENKQSTSSPESKEVESAYSPNYKSALLLASFEHASEQTKNIKSERKRDSVSVSSSFDFRAGANWHATKLKTSPIEVIKKRLELSESETLELGIEVVAAMKASLCNWNIEQGRFMALEDTFELTEADIVGSTDITIEHLPFHNEKVVPFERERLHKQAIFAANAVITFLNNPKHT